MKRFGRTATAAAAVAIALGTASTTHAKASTEVGVDASEWSSSTLPGPGIYPVGGAGQLNGEFTIVERDDIQIGLRATDRTDGLLDASGKNKGRYTASTGFDDLAETRAEWNYDIHVDLRGSGTTLADYDLTLGQSFSGLFDQSGPIDLGAEVPGDAVLFQVSLNPVFFNDTFDPTAEGSYNLELTLKPKAGGPPLIAQIVVQVED